MASGTGDAQASLVRDLPPLPRISLGRQLRVMLWKNWVLTKRNPRDLLREWLWPIVLLIVLVVLRTSLQPVTTAAEPHNDISVLVPLSALGSKSVYFAPCAQDTPADPVYNFMTKFRNRTNVDVRCFRCDRPSGSCKGDTLSMQDAAAVTMDDIWGGVVFTTPSDLHATSSAGAVPPTVDYVIRMDSTLMPGVGEENISSTKFGPSRTAGEFYPSFLAIQSAVETTIAEVTTGLTGYPAFSFQLKEFPFPEYTVDIGTLVLSNIIPIYFLLIFSLQVRVLIMRILEEKQKRIKEGMKMMGLNDVVFFGSWMITALAKGAVVVTAVTIVCSVGKLFSYSNPLLVLIWFLAFLLVCISYTFIITAFFDQARTGGVVGMLGYLALFLPSLALRKPSVPRGLQLFSCILAPTAFSLGNGIFNEAEGNEVGIQFSNLFDESSYGISMGECLISLLIDAVLYSVGAWYFDRVIPSEYGTHYEPLFCCRRRFWCPGPVTRDVSSPLLETTGRDVAVESVSAEVEANRAVSIAGLCKTFSTKEGPKKAVDQLHLTMYQDQITCLLGHNGAGKSTTISMLTGLIPSTAGDAKVYGRSIVSDIQGVRELTGVCPQHDVLFDKLTVAEHLYLYGGIKGLPEAQLQAQVREMINELDLADKTNAMSVTLSGGQKRRLSVAMALMGDPKFVLLDEPTSGLDPQARRSLWQVLEKRKAGRVIVLCTHFMEEADILGDRIAVMAHGSLRVAGSSLYLKNRFGLGYHLTMAMHEGADVDAITATIRDHVPRATKEVDLAASAMSAAANREANRAIAGQDAEGAGASAGNGAAAGQTDDANLTVQVSYVLPMDAIQQFAGLFQALEDQRGELGIESYGLSMTTLEEVFLRLAEIVEQEELQAAEERRRAVSAAKAAGDAFEAADIGTSRTSKRSTDLSRLGAARSGRFSLDAQGNPVPAVAKPAKSRKADYVKLEVDRAAPKAFETTQQLQRSTWRHFKAVTTRLGQAAKRDKRGLFLQMVLPCVFVGLSAVFRSIAADSTVSPLTTTPMNPSQWTGMPTGTHMVYAYNFVSTVAQQIVANLPTPAQVQGMPPLMAASAASMSSSALDDYLLPRHNQAGALLLSDSVQLLEYNTTYTNWLPIAMNLVNNAALRAFRASHGIGDNINAARVAYDPFPLTSAESKPGNAQFLSAGLIGLYIALGFSAIPGLQALRVVKEREVKCKQQQFIMGMKPAAYWVGNLMWDSLQYLVPWVLCLLILYFVGTSAFRAGDNFFAVAVLLLLYGITNPCLVYAISFMFDKHTSAQTFTMLVYYIGTIVSFMSVFALSYPSVSVPTIVPEILDYAFSLFPNYALAKGMMDVNTKASCFQFGGPGPLCKLPSPFQWDILGQKLAFLAAGIPLWLAVVLLLEHVLAPKPSAAAKPHDMDKGMEYEDKDVRSERERVDTGRADRDNVVVRHLRKVFPAQNNQPMKVAVGDLTIGCREGECLGLLGPNGAGKTTALSMLTADLSPTFGHATVHGLDIFRNREEVYNIMGYCPQFDALMDLCTGDECLTFYARVKGVPESQIADFVDRSLTRMDLQRYRHQLTKDYSGGNKRKLSLAIAFVGAPRTVFLDEPSTGMDPVARRHMWDVVSSSRAGRTIFLTTHLLEEADVLASRIGILVNGRLACLGSPQRLKSLYGAGYRMEIKTSNPEHEEALHAMVRSFCPEARVLESHSGHINYELTREVSLAQVFATVEAERGTLEVIDYAVSQTSLEQVFLGFAKRQEESQQ